MQPVRKRAKNPIGRIRLLVFAAALLIIVALALFLLLRPAAKPVPVSGENDEADLTLLDYDEDALIRLTVTPRRSEPYTLRKSENGFVLETDESYPMREETVNVLTYYATHLAADEAVTDIADQLQVRLKDFGLEPGVCQVEAELQDGKRYTVTLGSAAPMSEVRYYACVSGDTHVYTVTSDVMDALNVPFYALHPVIKLSIDASLIDCISVRGQETFTARWTKRVWMMTEPFEYPLSDEAMETLLSALENLRFSTWSAEANDEQRQKYGLDTPVLTLSIDFAASVLTVPDEEGETQTFDVPESNITIHKGAAYSETADYYECQGGIMTGTVVTFSFLRDFSLFKYLAENPFIYGVNDLSALCLTANGKTSEYTVNYVERILPNNELETDEYGNVLYEMRVKKDGTSQDAAWFAECYQSLRSLGGAKMLDGIWTPGDQEQPILSMAISPEDGSESMNISLYPDKEQWSLLAVNGTAIFEVPLKWQEAILKLAGE